MADSDLNVVIFYDPFACGIATVAEYLNSFKIYSRHNIFYCTCTNATAASPFVDLNIFDVVIFHYSVRLCYDWHMTEEMRGHLMGFLGPKIAIVQDEYENTNTLKYFLKLLDISTVFTCVPQKLIEEVYPKSEFPDTKFINVLTGYTSDKWAAQYERYVKSYEERTTLVAYRGRRLPYWYGSLGQEKALIAEVARTECKKQGVEFDISIEDVDRINGDRWFQFMGNAVATLGTESGSEIFDFDGKIKDDISAYTSKRKNTTFDEIRRRFPNHFRDTIQMNQISPRIFEAIFMRSVLLLFEGSYSGIVKPHEHYIPLKKDGSNFAEAISFIKNPDKVRELTNNAFNDIYLSRKYAFETFVKRVDDEIANYKICQKNLILSCVTGSLVGGSSTASSSSLFSGNEVINESVDIYRGVPTSQILPPPEKWLNKRTRNMAKSGGYYKGSISICSNANWIEGHEPVYLTNDGNDSKFYASQLEDQTIKPNLSFDFGNTQLELGFIRIVSYDDSNHPGELTIRGKNSPSSSWNDLAIANITGGDHKIEFEDAVKVTSILLEARSFIGQQRFLLREVEFFGKVTEDENDEYIKSSSNSLMGYSKALARTYLHPKLYELLKKIKYNA